MKINLITRFTSRWRECLQLFHEQSERVSQFLKKKKYLLLFISIIGIFVDIFIFKFTSNLMVLGLAGSWIGAVIGWKLEGRFSILGTLIFLTMCSFLLVLKKNVVAEKAAIWAYMFLVIGVIQQLIEFKKKPKNLRDFNQFLNFLLQLSQKAKKNLKEKGVIGILKLLGSCFKKQWGIILSKIETWADKSTNSKVIKITKTVIIFLVRFLSKFWFPFCSFLVTILIFVEIGKEITFYHRFFENQYWQQIGQRMGIWLIAFWLGELALSLWVTKKWKNIKLRKVFIILLLLILWQGNTIIFNKIRGQFADKPYILRISPSIASRYMEVKIYGRNFRDLPFVGKILINDKEQIIKLTDNERAWGNQEIIMVADPDLSKTGLLEVWIDWNDEWTKSNEANFTYYDSETATPEEEKMFWESLKE